MMGESDPQPELYYNISLEDYVAADHPLRQIRPLIDVKKLRKICAPLYSPFGRPSVPPEQLFLALLGGYVVGITSERKLMMEVQCNMALRWFIGLGIQEEVWDASTFSQNRRRRFDGSGVLEHLFDETVKQAFAQKLISTHVSADGTLVRACFLQGRIPHCCKGKSPSLGWGILLLPHERVLHPVALSVEDQQVAVVDEAIDHRGGHRLIEKDVRPLAELQVRGEDQAAFLVAG